MERLQHIGDSRAATKEQATKVTQLLTGIDLNNKQNKAMWNNFVAQCVKPSLANMKDIKFPGVKSAKDITDYINGLTFPKGAAMKVAGKMTSCPQARPLATKVLKNAFKKPKRLLGGKWL